MRRKGFSEVALNNLTNLGVINALFERHGFSPSKRLGQNFLTNPAAAAKIAEAGVRPRGGTGRDERDVGVLEIGPGLGVLTRELSARADRVAAVEIDGRLIGVLDETLADLSNVKVVHADILKTDLKELVNGYFGASDLSVCANLPYNITSPVVMLLLESGLPFRSITVMVQKEAGVRLCAAPGSRESGAITVAVRYYSEPRLLFDVSRGSFTPCPRVDSCVIRLDPRESVPLSGEDEKRFFRVVRGAFSQRRKTIANSLSSSLNADKRHVISAADAAGLPRNVRPERLSADDFIKLSGALADVIG
jgi:16S rRNA (adenine1518-N6/adenine1519-N6)-dimethyltransferase